MKQLLTNQIVDPAIGEPFTGPMLTFLQNAYTEVIAAVSQNLTGNNVPQVNVPYALYGCIPTLITGSLYSFTQGYILYNGVIYLFPAISSINLSGGLSDCICTITTTTDSSVDPLTFTDGVPRNVTQVNTLVLSNNIPITNSPTQFNFSSVINLIRPKVVLSASINQTFAPFAPYGSTPNPYTLGSFTTPNDGITRTYKLDLQVGVKAAGNVGPANLKWCDYVVNIIVGGTQISILNPRFPTPSISTVGYSGYGLNEAVLTNIMSIGPNTLIQATISPGAPVFQGNLYIQPADGWSGSAGIFTCIEL
jgi:hypothetical protein